MSNMFYAAIIVAIVFAAISWEKYLKTKNQKPEVDPELEESLAKIEQLEERIRVLERIVTENKYDLGNEIDRL